MIIEADLGYDIFDKTWKKPSSVWGNHGYNNSLDSMRPLFIAYGPSFRSGFTLSNRFENVDLYPLMSYILGFKPHANNGTFEKVKAVLF